MDRHIPFEGIENFRDFGGYAGRGGRALPRGLLYRSAAHANATDADLAAMKALGVATIVDLRRPDERERLPSRRWDGFSATVIDNDDGQVGTEPWAEFLRDKDLTVATFTAFMMDYYDKVAFETRLHDLYRRYFQALARGEGAILIHCAAGKDRTGLLAALTHHVAGVHPDDIMADYLLTNDEARIARRLPAMHAHLEQTFGRRADDAAVTAFLRVEAAYLDLTFRRIAEAHGSLDAYLAEAIGLDPATRAKVEERLLA